MPEDVSILVPGALPLSRVSGTAHAGMVVKVLCT